MNIIIVGCGKVGTALATKLSEEGHNITVIDKNATRVQYITEKLDIMGLVGNGSSIAVLSEAGIESAEVFIAVTGIDEINLLCCMFAKKVGNVQAIARVRDPIYINELEFMRKQLGLHTIINPELTTAREIAKLLMFPAADKIDSFANERVRLLKLTIKESHGLDGIKIKNMSADFGHVLICAVEREEEVIIPDGNFEFKTGDVITFMAPKGKETSFFHKIGEMNTKPVKNAMIIGAGNIGYYLSRMLVDSGVDVRIIDINKSRCDLVADLLPEATVLCGDGSDREFLMEEGLHNAEAFVSLTNMDEENVFLSLYAQRNSKAKVVTKINRVEMNDILDSLDIGSTVSPKYLTADVILQNVRALQNASGSNIVTLYQLLDDRVEALEFSVLQESDVTNTPLKDLNIKRNQLICCIIRGNEIIVPRGTDEIHVGDKVIIVTLEHGLHDIKDIIQ